MAVLDGRVERRGVGEERDGEREGEGACEERERGVRALRDARRGLLDALIVNDRSVSKSEARERRRPSKLTCPVAPKICISLANFISCVHLAVLATLSSPVLTLPSMCSLRGLLVRTLACR